MTGWACTIDGCGKAYGSVEDAILHQTNDHERHECKICGTIVPDGYLAIRHTFEEHTRAEYVRAYGASSEEVREREQVKAEIEEVADLQAIAEKLA